MADEFLIDYNNAFKRGSYPKAAFELHQSAENFYKTIILVFTDYKPRTHDLDGLNKQAGYADARFKTSLKFLMSLLLRYYFLFSNIPSYVFLL